MRRRHARSWMSLGHRCTRLGTSCLGFAMRNKDGCIGDHCTRRGRLLRPEERVITAVEMCWPCMQLLFGCCQLQVWPLPLQDTGLSAADAAALRGQLAAAQAQAQAATAEGPPCSSCSTWSAQQ